MMQGVIRSGFTITYDFIIIYIELHTCEVACVARDPPALGETTARVVPD